MSDNTIAEIVEAVNLYKRPPDYMCDVSLGVLRAALARIAELERQLEEARNEKP